MGVTELDDLWEWAHEELRNGNRTKASKIYVMYVKYDLLGIKNNKGGR